MARLASIPFFQIPIFQPEPMIQIECFNQNNMAIRASLPPFKTKPRIQMNFRVQLRWLLASLASIFLPHF